MYLKMLISVILNSKNRNFIIHQHRGPISVKYVDIDKIAVSNRFLLVRKGFKYLIGYKHTKKLNLGVYFFQK